jgi:hypothetical protein
LKERGMPTPRLDLLPRPDGLRYRRMTLIVEGNGALTLNAHEMGAAAEAVWGLDDEEVTLSVAPDQVGRLALALAGELLKGRRDALDRLSDVCDAAGVPCRIACWS